MRNVAEHGQMKRPLAFQRGIRKTSALEWSQQNLSVEQ
jgi:hypothetical protein